MLIWNFLLMLLLQTPQAPVVPVAPPVSATAGQRVIVGLDDGMKITVDNPEFTGFIDGRNGAAVLIYRERTFHGEMPVKTISRIDFGQYKKGKPFAMKVTLRNGDELDVESELRDFVEIKGTSEFGTVTIKHPDPISPPLKLSVGKPNRKKNLTIQYLEFPAS
jgi:hypothetical protein